MLTPPVAPKMQSGDNNSDMDLEDGELEWFRSPFLSHFLPFSHSPNLFIFLVFPYLISIFTNIFAQLLRLKSPVFLSVDTLKSRWNRATVRDNLGSSMFSRLEYSIISKIPLFLQIFPHQKTGLSQNFIDFYCFLENNKVGFITFSLIRLWISPLFFQFSQCVAFLLWNHNVSKIKFGQ